MTAFELSELHHFELIYTVGSIRIEKGQDCSTRDGIYHAKPGEHLAYRYIVDKEMGAGAFGTVLKCQDMKDNGRIVAIKISK